jgi:TOMM system kinase/cyclase fusion protein
MSPSGEPRLQISSIFQGGYEILAELGTGSYGRVYKARQLSTSQEVAIKILRLRPDDGVADIAVQTDRFRREMRLCAGLAHPNIVRLIDSGESDEGILYTVFEFVPGSTLRAVLAEEGKLGLREVIHLMGQVLDALSCAHARGVVHRDLKPENIMVTKTGARRNALVLDFGLGGLAREARDWELPRITATGELMGTPCYAAPEQLRGEPASTRSDLYSWGLIFLECLTGELAVSGASAHEVIVKQIGPDPIPIPAWVRKQRIGRLLEAVTAKQIEKRDVTVEGLLQALGLSEFDELQDADVVVKSQPLPAGERRQLTLVCCRLGITRVDGGPTDLEEVDALLHAQHAIIGELAGRSGGHIAGIMADRVLLAFGYPHAHEDDARRAARTALAIAAEADRADARLQSDRGLRVEARFGIHTGLVIARELRQMSRSSLDQLIGPTPQLAAALAERAAPGEVLVSIDTHRLLRGEIAGEAVGALALSELSGSLPTFRLVHRLAATSGLDTVPATRETPLVGRAKQLDELLAAWTQASLGKAGIVLIRGEPGLGKSRLVRELRRHVPAASWFVGRCVLENQGTPLRPIADLLSRLDEPIESLLARHGFDLAETMPLFEGLLSLVSSGRYPPLSHSRERQKELTLNALLALLMKMAEAQPRVLAFEDLHWADPTTLEFVGLLVHEIGSAQVLEGQPCRLCAVFTARPEFEPPWPTENVAMMHLSRLGNEHVEEMITAGLAHGRALPKPLVDEIIRRADGIPLFIEEVTRVLMDAEATGKIDDASEPPAIIPSTLRDLLTARLDGLQAGVKDTVQLAAVVGREFRYEVLKAVSRKEEDALREDLSDLTNSGLIFHRRSVRSESYVFKHALLRDTAYELMVRSRRHVLHGRVANTLQQRFPDIARHRPEILAQHFERGGQIETAVEYWIQAGDRALRRAAYIEATHQLEHGLTLVRSAAESPRRDKLEIELLTILGTVFFSTKGYSADEVERTFARARELCEKLREEVPAKVLVGIMGVHLTRGDRAATLALLPLFEALARRDDPVSAITGHATLGLTTFFQGDFVAARDHLSVAKPYYGTEEFQQYAKAWGYDGGLLIHAYLMSTLWYLGYPDQAEALRREMVAHAEAAGDPYSMLIALSFSTTITLRRGDTAATLDLAMQVMARSTAEKLYVWMAAALLAQGGALLQQGEVDTAIAQMRQGLDIYRSIGLYVSYGFYLTYLAEAYAAAGNAAEGLAVAEEGLSLCRERLARFPEAEFLRLKGDLQVVQGDMDAATNTLQQALDVARQDHAKSVELRAALAMSRVLQLRGSIDEAGSLLGGVYNWFTEGFETKDLRDAKALLTDLRR